MREKIDPADLLPPQSADYGNLTEVVRYLRKKEWVIFKRGLNYQVGHKLLDEWGVRDLYEREKNRDRPFLVAPKGPKRKKKAGVPSGGREKKRSGGGRHR